MTEEKYVVVDQREYDKLLEKATAKKPTARKLSLAEGKKLYDFRLNKGARNICELLGRGFAPLNRESVCFLK